MGRLADAGTAPRDVLGNASRAIVLEAANDGRSGDHIVEHIVEHIVDCIKDLLNNSTEAGMLLTAAGVVHWANDAFWLLPGVDGARGPSALLSVLNSDDRAVLVGTLLKMRDDRGSRRIQVAIGRSAVPPVELALTALPIRSQLIAARVVECAGARELIGRARAMESALLQIRQELSALGQDRLGRDMSGTQDDPPSIPLPHDLPARQRDVATLLIEGMSLKDIASKLDLSLHTVRNHLKVVFRRTGVHSRAAFVARYHA